MFKANYAPALAIVQGRSASVASELNTAVAAVDAVIATATIDQLKPLMSTVSTKFGIGVTLVNAAARNAVPGKPAITLDDQVQVIGLNDIKVHLARRTAAWKAGNYAVAGGSDDRSRVGVDAVQPALAAKGGSDAALRTALNGFKAVAGTAGSTAAFDAAYAGAVDATNNAQQVIAGQFWLVPAVQSFVNGLPTA